MNATGAWAPELTPGIEVRKRKGHLVITDRYPGFVRHQLIELGYLKSAHSTAADSVAFNVQPRRTGQVLIGSSRQYGAGDSAIDAAILSRMIERAWQYMLRVNGASVTVPAGAMVSTAVALAGGSISAVARSLASRAWRSAPVTERSYDVVVTGAAPPAWRRRAGPRSAVRRWPWWMTIPSPGGQIWRAGAGPLARTSRRWLRADEERKIERIAGARVVAAPTHGRGLLPSAATFAQTVGESQHGRIDRTTPKSPAGIWISATTASLIYWTDPPCSRNMSQNC